MGRLKRIEMEDFKSYKGHHIIGPFEQFTCIIGPNGAGKSNLMDAISFVLAISTKFLRSQNLMDLIYRNDQMDRRANTCCVTLFYEVDDAEEELYPSLKAGNEIEFCRRVNSNGTSQYKVNGKQVSAEDYVNELAKFNILVSCRNFLVYQGDVQNISARSPQDLTLLFEQISGSYDLKDEYNDLQKKRDDAKTVMDANLKKRYTMISEKKVEEQKEEAENFSKMESLLRDLRVEYFLWQLYNQQSNLQLHQEKKQKLEADQVSLEDSDARKRAMKDKKQREIAEKRDRIRLIEKKVRETEDNINKKQPDSIKLEDRIRRRKYDRQCAEEIDRLTEEIEMLTKEDVSWGRQISLIRETLSQLEQALPQTQTGVVMDSHQKERYAALQREFDTAAGTLDANSKQQRRAAETLEEQIRQKRELIASHGQERDSTLKLVEELKSQLSRLRTRQSDTHAVIKRLESESERLANEYTSNSAMLNEKRMTLEKEKEILDRDRDSHESDKKTKERMACVARLQALFPGVLGLLVDLCHPSQKKSYKGGDIIPRYSVAVNTALGKHLHAVIVNSKVVAIECIQYLREQHLPPMDFYPLESINPDPLKVELRGPGRILCYDLLEFDHEERDLDKAILYAAGNTLITETLSEARELAYRKHIGEKVVTVAGEEIARSGAMTGGVGRAKKDLFQEKAMMERSLTVEKLQRECNDLEKAISRSASSAERVRSTESDVMNQRGRLRVFDEEIDTAEKKIKSYVARIGTLDTNLAEEQADLQVLQRQASQRQQENEAVQKQLSAIESRVFGTFLHELGVETVAELESEFLSKIRDNEGKQTECRTHLTLLESKKTYGMDRIAAMTSSLHDSQVTLGQNEKKEKMLLSSLEIITCEMKSLEEKVYSLKSDLDKEQKVIKDAEIVIQQYDVALRENRGKQKKLQDAISEELCAIEALSSKRSAVLKSAVVEQVEIPLKHNDSAAEDSNHMEVEEGSQGLSQLSQSGWLTQSQSYSATNQSRLDAIEQDAAMMERIDFSSIGENAVERNENGYATRDENYRTRIAQLTSDIDRMVPNMLADQKFREISDKVTAMNNNRRDLNAQYDATNKEFLECQKERKDRFMQAFTQIQAAIDSIYKDLTRSPQFSAGGQAELGLENDTMPFLGGVKYYVYPVGKQIRDISLLSGGEKTVATLALLFALHSYRKAPFFIMDEIDDALDNANVERVAKFIMSTSQHTQCIIISHKDLLFEKSSSLVGVYQNGKEASSAILTIDLRKYDTAEHVEN